MSYRSAIKAWQAYIINDVDGWAEDWLEGRGQIPPPPTPTTASDRAQQRAALNWLNRVIIPQFRKAPNLRGLGGNTDYFLGAENYEDGGMLTSAPQLDGLGANIPNTFSNLFSSATGAANQVQTTAAAAQQQLNNVQSDINDAKQYAGGYLGLTLLFQGLSAAAMVYMVWMEAKRREVGKKRRRR